MAKADGEQLGFWGINGVAGARHPHCLVSEFLGPDDSACTCYQQSNYEVLSCGTEKGIKYLNDVRGATFENVHAVEDLDIPDFPLYIPGVSRGSRYYLQKSKVPWVAVTLPHVMSKKGVLITQDIRDCIGVGGDTKILLLPYGPDALIEKVWTGKEQILPLIARLNVDAMASFDYSMFLDQPHLERLVNMKRNLITFEHLQQYGAHVIPHIYWGCKKDIERWANWLLDNPSVKTVSMCWSLYKTESDWEKVLGELTYFNSLLLEPPKVIITGPSIVSRIEQLITIAPNVVINNGTAARCAVNHVRIDLKGRSNVNARIPFEENVSFYTDTVAALHRQHADQHVQAEAENTLDFLMSRSGAVGDLFLWSGDYKFSS